MKGAIILAATTGLRLGDVVRLKWGDLNQDTGFIVIETQKTGEVVNLPIHQDFKKWLKQQETGIGNAPVFPTLFGKKVNGKMGLSSQFRGIMKDARITEKVIAKAGDAGRARFSKGFHAIRHTFVSTLANANVPMEVRQKLTAHSDKASHQIYTTLDLETFTAAVKKSRQSYKPNPIHTCKPTPSNSPTINSKSCAHSCVRNCWSAGGR